MLTASFQDILGKLVAKCETIQDFSGGDSDDNQNSKACTAPGWLPSL